MNKSGKQIGSYQAPPTQGQIAMNLAGNSAASGKFSVIGGPQGYAGVGVPVYKSPQVSASVGAFSTFGKNMPKGTGVGAGVRFHF